MTMTVKTAVVALLFLLLSPLLSAAELRWLDVDRKGGHIFVASETYFDAPPAAVFDILSDYDGFHRISKVFTETRYIERDDIGNGTVYSKAKGCVLFFCSEIERVEQLELTPGKEIVATALPEQSDVDFSVSRWVFEPEGDGTRVFYGTEFKPSFWVPPLLGPLILHAKLQKKGSEAADRVEELANNALTDSARP